MSSNLSLESAKRCMGSLPDKTQKGLCNLLCCVRVFPKNIRVIGGRGENVESII